MSIYTKTLLICNEKLGHINFKLVQKLSILGKLPKTYLNDPYLSVNPDNFVKNTKEITQRIYKELFLNQKCNTLVI